ncbi:MAG: flagellin, partial [Gammaproteobacteria bacterium]
FTLEYGGSTVANTSVSATVTDTSDLSSLLNAINGKTATTGITATFTTDGVKSGLTLTSATGKNIGVTDFAVAGGGNESISLGSVSLTEGGNDSAMKVGTIALSSASGPITAANASTQIFASATASSTFSSVASLDISTSAGATAALSVVDAAISAISSSRGDLGAIQNRLLSTISNLTNVAENVTSARSRITDADFAAETANLTRASILQQAGISVLAQANALPQQTLALLQ